MYKVVLIDDEIMIKEGFQRTIDWAGYGMEFAGFASDGKQGLELYHKEAPDIVFADINMPFMDGLELAERIKHINENVIVIILTGYNDFLYAQKAIKIGVFDFLLKPLQRTELVSILIKAKDFLDQQKKIKLELEDLKLSIEKNIPVIRENFYYRLVFGNIREQELLEKVRFLNLDILCDKYALLLLKMDGFHDDKESLLPFAVMDIVDNVLKGRDFKYLIFQDYRMNIVCVLGSCSFSGNLESTGKFIINCVNNYLKCSVMVAVSSLCSSLCDIRNAYIEAAEALDYSFLYGNNSIIYYSTIKDMDDSRLSYPYEQEEAILNAFKLYDREKLEKNMNIMFEAINSHRNVKYSKRVCTGLILMLFKICNQINADTESLIAECRNLFNRLEKTGTINEIEHTVKGILERLMDQLDEKRNKKTGKIVKAAMEYISSNYQNSDLGLADVAEYLGISSGYLSSIFKAGTDRNVSDYLNSVRVEKAGELLKNSFLKVYEVAYEVGFNDNHYFSQVFKNLTGMSPTEYRNI